MNEPFDAEGALRAGAASHGVHLRDEQMLQFRSYLALLTDWSKRANLVGSADEETVVRRHFLESIAVGAALRERELLRPEARVLDVGAGAGFPGAVLKIAWPTIRLSLLEATKKKCAFLEALVVAAGLGDSRVLCGRAETLAHDEALRERFDLVLARAVAPLPALLELALPFARIGGRLVAPKGSRAESEAALSQRAVQVLGGGAAMLLPLAVLGPPQTLVVVVKQRPTPREYPRRPGTPGKSPL